MRLAGLLACGALVAAPLAAQGGVQSSAPGPVLTGRDLGIIAGATAATGVLSLPDVPIARRLGDSTFRVRHAGLASAATRASLATETVLMLAGGTVYGIARLRKDDGTADVALHATESVASAALVIQVVRGVVGRARPYVIGETGARRDSDPYDFVPLHGFTSFAVASALSREMQERDTPHRRRISPALYVGAAMPALGRMILDEQRLLVRASAVLTGSGPCTESPAPSSATTPATGSGGGAASRSCARMGHASG